MIPCKLIKSLYFWALLVTYKADANTLIADEYVQLYEVENGYEKYNTKSPLIPKNLITSNTVIDEKNNIRCGFRFIALSYMCISKYLLRWDGEDRIDAVIDHIKPLSQHAYKMIIVLYNIGFTGSVNDMWLFYLYTSKIQLFRAYINNENESSFKEKLMDMYDIHLSIVEKLKKNIWRCRKNRLYVDNRESSLYNSYKFLSRSDDFNMGFRIIEEHRIEVSKLIAANEKLDVGKKNAEYVKIDRLYLNDLVLRDDIMDELQSAFDCNITWGTTKELLKNTCNDLKDNPNIVFDGWREFQRFHSLFKNMIKTILLRIIWSHLLILERDINNNEIAVDEAQLANKSTVKKENKKLLKIVIPFVLYLDLQADDNLKELVKCFKENSWLCLTDKLGVVLISHQLKIMPSRFEGLNALNNVLSEEDKLKDKYRDWIKLAEKNQLSVQILPDNKFTSLNINYTRAAIFSKYVCHILENIDFQLMRSLFESSNVESFDRLKTSQLESPSKRYGSEITMSSESNYLSSEGNIESQNLEVNDDNSETKRRISNFDMSVQFETGETSYKNQEHSSDDSDNINKFPWSINKNLSGNNIFNESSVEELESSEDSQNENVGTNIQGSLSSSGEKEKTHEREKIKEIEKNIVQGKGEFVDSKTETLLNENVETGKDLYDTLPNEPNKFELSNKSEEIGFENSENTPLDSQNKPYVENDLESSSSSSDEKKDTGKIENIGYENVENPDTMSNKTKSIEPKKSEVPLIQREDSSSGSLEKLSLEQFSGYIQENVNDGIILKESSEKELLKIEDRQNVKVGNINVKSSSSSSEDEPEGEWKEHTEIINVEIETTKKKLNENSSKDFEKRYLEKFPRLVDESPDEDRKSSRETSQSDTIKIKDNENKNILNVIQEDIGSVELRDATDVEYVSDKKDTINQNEENVARSVNITDTISSIPDVGEENRFDHIYQNYETTEENTLLTGVRSRGISDEEADAETQSEIVSIFLENIAKSKNNDNEEQSRLKLDDLIKSDHNETGFAEEKNKPNYDSPVEISTKSDVSNKVESTDVASSKHPLNDNPDSIHTWMELYENSGIFESTQYNDKSEESSEVQSEEIQYDNNAEEYVSSSDENPIILGSKDTQADVEERGYAKEDDSEELKFLARGNIKLEKKTDFGNVDTDVPKEMQVSHVKHNDTERTRLHEKKTRSIDLTDIQNVQGLHNIFSDKENNVKVEDTNSEDKNKRKDIETTHTSDYIPTLIGMKYVPQTESKNKGHEIHEHIPKQVKSDEYNYFEISDSSSVKIKELLPESSPKMGKGTVLEPDSSAINEHVPMQAKSDEYISSEISDSSSVEKEEPLPKPSPKVVKDTLDEIVTVSTQPSFSIAQNSSSSSSATSSLELPPTNQVDWENLPTKFYNSLFENQEYFWSIDEYKKKVESSSSNSD